MKDAENLSKLLSGATPAVFKTHLADCHGLELPKLDKKEGKRRVVSAYSQAISQLSFEKRQALDEWAESINILTDGPGKDAIKSVRIDKLSEEHHEEFDNIGNQYDRSLWLYANSFALFREAVNSKNANEFRQKVSCYTGFLGPKSLDVNDSRDAINKFISVVSTQMGCPEDQVAVEVFQRVHPSSSGNAVALYQVNIHHNLAPEAVDCVKKRNLHSEQIVRAVSSFITYEPSTGNIDVLSKNRNGRDILARATADCLLESPIEGERIPIKQYDYQFLSSPVSLNIAGEPVDAAKVVRLCYAIGGRVLEYRIGAKDLEDIHTRASQDIHPQFRFSGHRLTSVWIRVQIRRTEDEKARPVIIVLSGENGCNIKTKREKDRILCEVLLQKWGVIKEVKIERSKAENDA